MADLEKIGRYPAAPEFLVREHAHEERAIGGHARDLDVIQRPMQPLCRFAARLAPRDDLAEHGIVERRDFVAGVDADVEPQAGRGIGPAQVRDSPDARQIPVARVFGVQARFHGGAMLGNFVLLFRQAGALRDAQLPLHEIDAGDEFGDRVLDLQAGIHFHEVKMLGLVDQELHGAGTHVADCPRRLDCGLRHPGAHLLAQPRRRRLLDDFLMAALHRAVAIEQAHDAAVGVGEHLHLHVARPREIPFQQQPIVAERGARQALCGFDCRRNLGGGIHDLHALAAAPRAGFDDEREADTLRLGQQPLRRLVLAMIAGRDGYSDGRHGRLGCALGAHGADRRSGRPDEDQTGVAASLRESGVLGEKTIAGVHGVGADAPRQIQNLADVEVAVRRRCRPQEVRFVGQAHMARVRVGLGVHRDAGQSHALRRARNAADDFAAVGDQQSSQHGQAHIRNTPKRVAAMSCRRVKARANPRTRRVSSGSITPSSQRRADA